MSKFKVGDKVRRIGSSRGDVVKGEVYTVSRAEYHSLCVKGAAGDYEPSFFELAVDEPKAPHQHAALIKAWADGAEIEYRTKEAPNRWGKWNASAAPTWTTSSTVEYRIKPEPKPDRVVGWGYVSKTQLNRVEFTLDGETGNLKFVSLKES